MRFLIIDTYYPEFLSAFYKQNPDLRSQPYQRQWQALMNQCFGTADFYSRNLNRLGHEAEEVVANNEFLQCQWAKEHNLRVPESKWTFQLRMKCIPWLQRSLDWKNSNSILAAQVKAYKPDVLYIQDMNAMPAEFFDEIRPYVRAVVGQIACPMAANIPLDRYDLVLSSFPHFVENFRRQGIRSADFKLGFETDLLLRKPTKQDYVYDLVFIGGLSPEHQDRIRCLEAVAASQPLSVWGYGAERLNPNSSLAKTYRGKAWALDMYDILQNARIALNHHIDAAENYANNMRLFEATGMGTLLLTDLKSNLHEFFEIGKEVVTYRSPSECVDLIVYYLTHEEQRQTVSRAGQQRTLKDHTWYRRMQELTELVRPLIN